MRSAEILLVEDSPSDRLLTLAALAEANMDERVHSVDNGLDALDFLHRRGRYKDAPDPDLVLLDLNLPRLDGREVLRRMKADPYLRHIPVVVLTTSSAPEDIQGAYGAYCNSYIEKPVDFERFSDVVDALRSYWFEVSSLPAGRPRMPETPTFLAAGGMKVLLVEDSPSDALLVQEAIRQARPDGSVLVRAASTSAEAQKTLAEWTPDVILTDLKLPDSSGAESVSALRAAAPGLPILVLTGAFAEDNANDALDEGADDYLVKEELRPHSLIRALEFAVHRRRTMDRLAHAQQLEMVARLAGNVAHDFNNLLMVIRSCAGELKEQDGATAEEPIRDIIEASTRGERLVRQLLALGRRAPLARVRLDLTAHITAQAELIRGIARSSVQVMVAVPSTPVFVEFDPRGLDQIILNVASNALDAMTEGGRLYIEVRATGDKAEIVVSDTGPGIPADIAGRVFDPFFTTKPPSEGSGLGLSSARELVRQGGGSVELKSELGRGTRVTIRLPRVEGGDETDSPDATFELTPRSILVIEDEALVRSAVVRMLTRDGFEVTAVADLTSARRAWKTRRFAMVLTDIILRQGERGLQVPDLMIEDGVAAPVLYMSGYPGAADQRLVPMENYLPKPFTPIELSAFVRRALRQETS